MDEFSHPPVPVVAYARLAAAGISREEASELTSLIALERIDPFAWTPARVRAVMAWNGYSVADVLSMSRKAGAQHWPKLKPLSEAELQAFLAKTLKSGRMRELIDRALTTGAILCGQPPAFICPSPETGLIWLGLQFPPSCKTSADER